MAYIGVGEHAMCKECGVDVRNRFLHDNYHAEVEKLRAENRALTAKVEKLENDRRIDRLGILAVV